MARTMTPEALSINSDNLPTLTIRRQMISCANISAPKMEPQNGAGRATGLFHVLNYSILSSP
jgi:hypothetical protein